MLTDYKAVGNFLCSRGARRGQGSGGILRRAFRQGVCRRTEATLFPEQRLPLGRPGVDKHWVRSRQCHQSSTICPAYSDIW